MKNEAGLAVQKLSTVWPFMAAPGTVLATFVLHDGTRLVTPPNASPASLLLALGRL